VSWLAQNRRLVSVLILSWALLDLTVPGFCETETDTHNVPAQSQESQVCSLKSPEPSISVESSPVVPESCEGDDCWCCCAHVTPTPAF